MTHVYPVCSVRRGDPGDAGSVIDAEYNSIAARLDLPQSKLPSRLTSKKLPPLAVAEFGGRLLAELASAQAPLVVTLGEEAFRTLRLLPSLQAVAPVKEYKALYEAYGATGSVIIDGRKTTWLPLVHPSVLRSGRLVPQRPPPGPRSLDGWVGLHAHWAATVAKVAVRAASAPRPPPAPRQPRPPRSPRIPIAPEGSGYLLVISKARLLEPDSGGILDVIFECADGAHPGAVARGRFPLGKPGLAALVTAALGEPLATCDEALATRLVGARIVADTVHGGTGGHSLSLVRNLRPAAQ